MTKKKVVNIKSWIENNKKELLPPVCNKLIYSGQLKVFVSGGPNVRKDYHLNEGEELFYMVKGDMCLKVMERGCPKDVIIKEGEIFLLPARVPHSPQRSANTFGLIVERERLPQERDALRYYVEGTTTPLFERWFHCTDLGTQLKPIIKEYFSSDECKTQKPGKDSICKNPPYKQNMDSVMDCPKLLESWLRKIKGKLEDGLVLPLFNRDTASEVMVYGKGDFNLSQRPHERLLWQCEGNSSVLEDNETIELKEGDFFVTSANKDVNIVSSGTLVAISMPPNLQ